jgi:peptide/nickel transport system permease protein
MFQLLLRRLAAILPLIVIVTSFVFLVGQYGAGDLAAYLTIQRSGGRIDPELYQATRERLQLDDPVLVRYGRWLGAALGGDLGRSYVGIGEPEITSLIVKAFPITLQLALVALMFVVVVGVPLGVAAALTRNGPLDYAIVGLASLLSSIPPFVFAPVAMIVLVNQLHILPSVGLGWDGMFSQKVILPALCLAAVPLLNVVRFTRASLLEVLGQEYVRAARARGLSEWQTLRWHMLKNTFTPVLTVLGLTAGQLLSGAIFVETIFNLQGFGTLTNKAFQTGDIQTLTAIALVSAVAILCINLAVDLLYGLLDPRVRLAG